MLATAMLPRAMLSAGDWTAAGTWATFLVLLATLVYVILQVRDARELRREQFRPWLAVSFHFRSILAFVAVKNHGTTAARNVRIRFEPELESTLDGVSADVAMLAEETPVMVPGEERLVLFDRVPDRLKSDLPKRHDVFVDYSDHRGRQLPTERFVLDFGLLDGARLPDKGIHDLVEEIYKMRRLADSKAGQASDVRQRRMQPGGAVRRLWRRLRSET